MRVTESSPPPTPIFSPRPSRSLRPLALSSPRSSAMCIALNCTGYARFIERRELQCAGPRSNRPRSVECLIAFSWNSELPSGHNPFWIRDDALAGLGLFAGDAVAIDTRAEPRDGDLVVAEADIDGDSVRLARRYFVAGRGAGLEAGGSAEAVGVLPQDNVLVLGVTAARLRSASGTDQPPLEEPL